MAEPTLLQVFGANASQTATTLTITKADLIGLTARVDNTAESLLAAINLKAKAYLNPTNQETNPDIQITIEESDFQSFVLRNSRSYRQRTLSINLEQLDTVGAIDPDSY